MKQGREVVGKRRRAREMAIQMLYQLEIGGSSIEQVFAGFNVDDYVRETEMAAAQLDGEELDGAQLDAAPLDAALLDAALLDAAPPRPWSAAERGQIDDSFTYARHLVEGASSHGEAIDELIRHHADNWRLERMPVIDRNILRLAIYEMLHESGVPNVVIVDEAIELAKKFGSEQSGRFVNGLLDGVLKSGGSA